MGTPLTRYGDLIEAMPSTWSRSDISSLIMQLPLIMHGISANYRYEFVHSLCALINNAQLKTIALSLVIL